MVQGSFRLEVMLIALIIQVVTLLSAGAGYGKAGVLVDRLTALRVKNPFLLEERMGRWRPID